MVESSFLTTIVNYTVSQNKTPAQSFCDNFGKYNPFTIAFCHELRKKLLYNLPPHLKTVAALPCEKFERLIEQPFPIVIQFKSVQSRLFSVNVYNFTGMP